MNQFACINGRIALADGSIIRDRILVLADGRITSISEPAALSAGCQTIDLKEDLLLAGFIDTQVNGGGGALVTDAPNVETIRRMAQVPTAPLAAAHGRLLADANTETEQAA